MKSIVLVLITLSSMNLQAQSKMDQNWIDWANFKKYANQNSNVPSHKKGERRVVFLGNSIFEGWLQLRPEFFEGKPYYDRGISGQTTPQMLLRFYEDVVALNPDVLVFKGGINDIAQNTGPYEESKTLNNIKAIAMLARANGIKVILCSVLPADHFPWRPQLDPAGNVISLNKKIKDFATVEKFMFLDLYPTMANDKGGMKKEFSEDGVHPNVEGYKAIEPLVEEAINKVKK